MKKLNLKLSGMHCNSCSKLIESELEDNKVSSKIDSVSGKAIIDFDPKKISEHKIRSIINDLGYKIL